MTADQGSNTYRFIPGRSTKERVVYDIRNEPFFEQYTHMRARHNKHQRSREMHWARYPYCKLQLIEALLIKCQDTDWLQKHWQEVFDMYMHLICDKRLLFAQTREKTSVKCPDAWRSTKAREQAVLNGEPVHTDAITYRYYCLNHIRTDTKRLNYGEIFRTQGNRLIELWQLNTVCNPCQPWTPEEFLYILQRLMDDYAKVSRGRRAELLIPGSEQEDWEQVKVLGMTVREYYETRFQADGTITLEQWWAFVNQQLPRLEWYVVSLEQHMELLCQQAYKPFLLESQWTEYCQQKEQAQKMIELWRAVWKLQHKSNIEGGVILRDAVLLPRNLKYNKLAERFFCEVYEEFEIEEEMPGCIALIFLLRTQYDTLFQITPEERKQRWEKNHWKRDLLSEENQARLNPGYRLLRKMVECAENCLQYTAQERLSLSVPIVKWDDAEMWYGVLKNDLRKMVQAKGRENQLLLEKYRNKFYRASTVHKEVGEWIMQEMQQYDWSRIPWQAYAEKNQEFGAQYQSIGNYRMNWMKCCLLERIWIDQLVEQGYRNLHSLAQILFAKYFGKS